MAASKMHKENNVYMRTHRLLPNRLQVLKLPMFPTTPKPCKISATRQKSLPDDDDDDDDDDGDDDDDK
eukprot:4994738-Amphidinium_carterae.2